MIIDDISIKMLDVGYSTIYKPGDSEVDRNLYKNYTATSTRELNLVQRLPPIGDHGTHKTDRNEWTVEDYQKHIDELTKEKDNQEKYMKIQDDKYKRDRKIVEDTRSLLYQDKDDARLRLEAAARIEIEAKSLIDTELKPSIRNYDNYKVLTELETRVSDDLRRQVKRVSVRHDRLLKKELSMGCDKVLVDTYNQGKQRLEVAQERNERLLKKLNWYDTELNKFKDRLRPVKPSKSRKSTLPDIRDNQITADGGIQSNTTAGETVKLPAISGSTNLVTCDIDGIKQSRFVPHPPNRSNNAATEAGLVPHPPAIAGRGNKRFVRKFNNGVT